MKKFLLRSGIIVTAYTPEQILQVLENFPDAEVMSL